MDENKIVDVGCEVTKELARDVYDDIVHPSAEAAGVIVSLPIRGLRVLLSPIEKYLLNREESIKQTIEATKEKFNSIPLEKRCEPEAYVAVPAIQQISYCQNSNELREMYANLLTSSMNIDLKDKILPAFVNIIGQLSSDEAKLLKFFSIEQIPIIEVHSIVKDENGGYFIPVKNYACKDGLCLDITENYDVYVDNLERLKLIEVTYARWLNNLDVYEYLENRFLAEELEKRNLVDEDLNFLHGVIELTDLGKAFCKICLVV